MIDPQACINHLQAKGVTFFTGVPDSRLKELSATLLNVLPPEQHVIAANEGNALGLAIGHYFATGNTAVVYMQNSGLGNVVNPLTSLADKEVYAVPVLMLIGWRGQPGEKDEPQHVKQGRISPALLEALEVPYRILDGDSDCEAVVNEIWAEMMGKSMPAALLVKGGTFSKAPQASSVTQAVATGTMKREAAIARMLDVLGSEDCVLATTGKTGRELFELRVARGEEQRDFLAVGGMGHCSSVALGAALALPHKRFICLDGDGALLMHMGAMAVAGSRKPKNFIHVLLNNQCHESVGGQPTCVGTVDCGAVAKACGYAEQYVAADLNAIEPVFASLKDKPGPHFVEIVLTKGARAELGRPTSTPCENKVQFMKHLGAV